MLTEHPIAVLMLCVSIPKHHIAANENLDLLGMDGLAKVATEPIVSESNVNQ